jgi:hypothetical protein
MRSALLSFFLIVLSKPVWSQTYIPYPSDSSAKWYYFKDSHSFQTPNCCYHYFVETFIGDSVLNGLQYSQLYQIEYASHPFCQLGNPNCLTGWTYDTQPWFLGLMREDSTKKVWFVEPLDANEQLVYDFGIAPGDTSFSPFGWGLVCQYIDSVWVGNQYRKRFVFDDNGPNWNYWIEGIGNNWYWKSQREPFEEYTQLLCFSLNDSSVFGGNCPWLGWANDVYEHESGKPAVEIHPSRVSGIGTFYFHRSEPEHLFIYTSTGHLVRSYAVKGLAEFPFETGRLPSGMYFFNARGSNGLIGSGKFIIE